MNYYIFVVLPPHDVTCDLDSLCKKKEFEMLNVYQEGN